MKLNPPAKIDNLIVDTQKVYDVLNHESDIACVLIGTSYLSELLGSAIRTALRKGNTTENLLTPGKGILGSFKSRVDLAYCLNIISVEDRKDLDIIGNIRNSFAHLHLSFDFKDEEVEAELRNLNAWKIQTDFNEINSDPQIESIPEYCHLPQTTREKFILALVMIKQRIISNAVNRKL